MSTNAASELIESYATKITSHWHKAASEILEVAKLCVEANAKLGSDGRKQLVDKLPFDHSRFSMLLKIGRNVRINTPEVRQLLPPSFTTIYEVAQLTEGELQMAITTNILHPKSRREDFKKWRKNKLVPKGAARFPLYARVHLTKKLSSEEMNVLRQAIDQLGSEFGLKIARPEDFHNTRSAGWSERVLRYIRTEARKIAKRELKRSEQARGGCDAALPKPSPEEIVIERDADEDQIKQVLMTYGLEEELGFLQEKARRKYPHNGPYDYWPDTVYPVDLSELDEFLRSRTKKKKFDFGDFT